MVRSTAVAKPVGEAKQQQRHQPIDMVHLGRQALGDRDLESEVLRLFDIMSRTYFGRLENSTSVAELRQHLHTLKGAAAGIGAARIAELARLTEEELQRGDPVNPERIDDLGIAVQECSAFITELLDDEAE